jgi:hypothetical protein
MLVVMMMRAVIGIFLRVRVTPEHELFKDEERADTGGTIKTTPASRTLSNPPSAVNTRMRTNVLKAFYLL